MIRVGKADGDKDSFLLCHGSGTMITLLAIGYLVATVVADEPEADPMMGHAQMMMFAGFIMLGWVLARRTIRNRKRSRINNREANRELEKVRSSVPSVTPLVDAPVEIQRWQGAMFDLSRELTSELEDRIVTVQSLLTQIDAAPGGVSQTQSPPRVQAPPITGSALTEFIRDGLQKGTPIDEMARVACIDAGEVRWTIAAMTPDGKVESATSSPADVSSAGRQAMTSC